jgi:cytochrome c peroxidase
MNASAKKWLKPLRVGILILACFGQIAMAAPKLEMLLTPKLNGVPIAFDRLAYTNAQGQSLSVSRLDLLLSDFAVHTSDGTWLEQPNWQAWLALASGRSRFSITNLPDLAIDRIRFHIGLPPQVNHSNPAQYAPDHALNPNLNGMHWSWSGGYIFFALEGHWQTRSNEVSGYVYHLANDPMLMTVALPIGFPARTDQPLNLQLDLDPLFSTAFTEDSLSTHSRKGDSFANSLKDKITHTFTISLADKTPSFSDQSGSNSPQLTITPGNLTRYRFSFSEQFPIPDLPKDNPLTVEGVDLGRRLFSERKLSMNNSQSCASCHKDEAAFTDAGNRYSLGAEGQPGNRNAMPLYNLAWKKSFFWEGRALSLREQVLLPIQNPIEMHENLANVTAKLAASSDYPARFEKVFGPGPITPDRIARALEQFLLSIVSCDSQFDQAMRGQGELSAEEKRGFELFMTEFDPRRGQYGADCFHCHGGPLFQSQTFANNGLDSSPADPGRSAVTGREADTGKFAVPSLRNVAITAPYMHDGRFKRLEEVIEHYSSGLQRSATLDPNLAKHPTSGIQLSSADKRALVAFLQTLTDEQFRQKQMATAK